MQVSALITYLPSPSEIASTGHCAAQAPQDVYKRQEFDSVTLQQIRQIPGVTGVITTLYDSVPGEVWPQEKIHTLKAVVELSLIHI